MNREEALAIVAQLKKDKQQFYNTLRPLIGIQSDFHVEDIMAVLKILDHEIQELEGFLQ